MHEAHARYELEKKGRRWPHYRCAPAPYQGPKVSVVRGYAEKATI